MVNPKTLTRVELVDQLVQETGLSRSVASDLFETMLDLIGESLTNNGSVKLSRFGNFTVRKKAAREGRNPKTGIEANISARQVVTFKPSPMLKDRVGGKKSET